MLSDRSYLRDSYPRTTRSALVWMLSATIGGFILINFFQNWLLTDSFRQVFSLSLPGFQRGFLWQTLTYGFLHAAGDPFHILVFCFNVLCLYLLGRDLELLLGSARFVWLYVGGILLGATAWLATHLTLGGGGPSLVGAWPGIAALFTVFACLNANQRIPLLIFFVLPVTLKPKYLLAAALALDLLGFFFRELRQLESPLGYHSAHLGGFLAGFLYFQFVHQREWREPDGRAEVELPKWLRKKQQSAVTEPPVFRVNLDRQGLKNEVDRILDKINSEGFAALTEEEKRFLDEAKDMLSRH